MIHGRDYGFGRHAHLRNRFANRRTDHRGGLHASERFAAGERIRLARMPSRVHEHPCRYGCDVTGVDEALCRTAVRDVDRPVLDGLGLVDDIVLHREHVAPRVKAFIDFILSSLKDEPTLHDSLENGRIHRA